MNDLVFHSGMGLVPESPHFFYVVWGGPLENLWGGGGGRSTKKYVRARENEMKKIHTRQLTLKNLHTMA